ncbi:(Fe-S)-binding protein [Chloroflexota bacterium]
MAETERDDTSVHARKTEEKRLPLASEDFFLKYYYDAKKIADNCCRWGVCKWVPSWVLKSPRFSKVCPSIAYYLFDAYSMQGRMNLASALWGGKLKYEDSPELLDIVHTCLMCGGCDAQCKNWCNEMEGLRVMEDLRANLVGDGELLPNHIPIIDNLRKEDNMMMKPKTERDKWAEGLGLKNLTVERAEVVFHVGCCISYDEELWKVVRGALSLLKDAGVDVGIMGKDEICCGGRAYDMGYRGEFTKYAESNIEAWNQAGVKTVVTSCSDCYLSIKRRYPELDSKFDVLHISEFIDRLLKEGKLKLSKTIPITVTYHDPCHLGRRTDVYEPGKPIEGIFDPPRDVITSIPGVTLVEMERIREYAWCCGAGSHVREVYHDFSTWTAGERIEEASATGAEALVTACPWCERNFIDSINLKGEKIKILDIVELVEQAI